LSRTGFFLTAFPKWRAALLPREAKPTVFADLGYGMLDGTRDPSGTPRWLTDQHG
jgi:hypothetical protein